MSTVNLQGLLLQQMHGWHVLLLFHGAPLIAEAAIHVTNKRRY